ncbi:MAG: Ribosomal RNA small subunit methyltransferase I [Firmicutes bacterium ADurb.Bin300]|nr:MAG: Ribosomal RNA small subunit methyltransferase I [Firmicutes bacterium ADurb.Bin300]
MKGTLYIVGTPIGNLSDISPRALTTLGECDFIAAEDTRVTIKLLNHFEIKKPLISYHEHNSRERSGEILERLLEGQSCALVCDAGMPLISDPGEDLVKLCRKFGVVITVIPGPSAVISALALSGMSAGRFAFEGFLTTAKTNRKKHLRQLENERRTMVFYEAPHKLASTLKDMLDHFGDRNISIVKEITKIHENVEYTTLKAAAEKYEALKLKGEFVLIVEGAPEEIKDPPSLSSAVALAKRLSEDGLAMSEAAKKAAGQTGVKKGDIYKALVNGI